MTIYTGCTISGFIFIGKAKIYRQKELKIIHRTITEEQIPDELTKLKSAITQLEAEYQGILSNPDVSYLDKEILDTHLMIVTDIEITQILELAVKNNLLSAEQAVEDSFKSIIRNFENMENNFFAQRADDYKDVARKLLTKLIGKKEENTFKFHPDEIVFLKDITPSEVTTFTKAGLKSYCSEHGSYTSHSSILSRSLGLNAIVAKQEIIKYIKDGDTIILDTEKSIIIHNPEPEQLSEYQQKIITQQNEADFLKSTLSLPAITQTNIPITVKANIEYPGEAKQVIESLCQGVGLFRTEFLYLNRNSLPSEQEQTAIYTELLQNLKDLPVTIRTFDLGGDKLSFFQQYKPEENPYLGNRGIRFSLLEKAMFKTQIRAILKASVYGKPSIMFPMIISLDDFKKAKEVVFECMKELDQEGIAYTKSVPLGAMIETPSAALCSEHLATECDFMSLGTNDLVQYTLAVDRNNDKVAPYYVQHHPAVLMLIKQTIVSAKKAGIPLSICGEMASEPQYIPLLIGLGITELSINPAQTAYVKAIIRNCDNRLFEIINNFDFNTIITKVEHLLLHTLKPYYTIQS
jgi:phosphotransferase system enzyme I (PtsI)